MYLVCLLGAVGCGRALSPDGHLDPDAPPVTNGNWYRPAVSATWQWQLQGEVNTSYDAEVYDIDLFEVPQATIDALHDDGRRVICYFSAGSVENFRPDHGDFLKTDSGRKLDGYPDERWLDIRSANVHEVMKARLDLAVSKQCDGVEPDNVTAFLNKTGFDLTATDQRAYNRFLGNEAHLRDLSVALKNDLEQVDVLLDYFDFQVNEQCHQYDECEALYPFIDAGKPVLNAEYRSLWVDDATERDAMCATALSEDFRTLVLPVDLDDAFRFPCD